MGSPASPPKFTRTCPACKRPVGPGYKFCETCGTHIPELSTCSKCGTRFIAPVKYCDLCGALVVPGEVPEPMVPEHPDEEDSGADEDQVPEQGDEEVPEHDTDEVPEEHEETIVPSEDETPHRYKKEILEPDTDELLETYGKEYAEDETLESLHTQKSPTPLRREAKKQVTVPAPEERGSPETFDDALFMSPGKSHVASKPPVNRIKIIGVCIVVTALVAAVYFIGLPMLTGTWGHGAPGTPTGEEKPTVSGTITPALTQTTVPPSRALIPLPTQTLPPGQKLYFHIDKNPVTSKITVIFTGSAGEGSISSADIKVTHPDGSVTTGIIQPLKGVAESTLEGSNKTDRVEIIAKMSSGQTYRVFDALVPV